MQLNHSNFFHSYLVKWEQILLPKMWHIADLNNIKIFPMNFCVRDFSPFKIQNEEINLSHI